MHRTQTPTYTCTASTRRVALVSWNMCQYSQPMASSNCGLCIYCCTAPTLCIMHWNPGENLKLFLQYKKAVASLLVQMRLYPNLWPNRRYSRPRQCMARPPIMQSAHQVLSRTVSTALTLGRAQPTLCLPAAQSLPRVDEAISLSARRVRTYN